MTTLEMAGIMANRVEGVRARLRYFDLPGDVLITTSNGIFRVVWVYWGVPVLVGAHTNPRKAFALLEASIRSLLLAAYSSQGAES
jgi:hypothetical protein